MSDLGRSPGLDPATTFIGTGKRKGFEREEAVRLKDSPTGVAAGEVSKEKEFTRKKDR